LDGKPQEYHLRKVEADEKVTGYYRSSDKILMFIYPTYNHNWRYIYITRLASKEIFSPSNKIHREVGRAKDFSAFRHNVCWKS